MDNRDNTSKLTSPSRRVSEERKISQEIPLRGDSGHSLPFAEMAHSTQTTTTNRYSVFLNRTESSKPEERKLIRPETNIQKRYLIVWIAKWISQRASLQEDACESNRMALCLELLR